ncbi:MAG: DUF1109 domain-containing protein [Burkholderiaceae bacterium]|jgi:hypothetical protein|nr:DUF1109 domain-containing protein [Burkholderiaceae bacterium]
MKTDTLIDMLARDAGPAPRALAARRLSPAAAGGLLASALAAITAFGLIPGAMFATAVPWMKMGYAGALAVAAGWLTARLSRPAAPTARPRQALVAVFVAMAVLGAVWLASQPEDERAAALLGHSWLSCPWSVAAMSLPALGAALWAVGGMAPTRPRAAGFAAGVFAGAIGAIGYALSCPEVSPAFVAVWYSLGIALTGGIGAALGPRVLRW